LAISSRSNAALPHTSRPTPSSGSTTASGSSTIASSLPRMGSRKEPAVHRAAQSATRRSSVRREMPSNWAARVLSPPTESSTARMCSFSSVCRSVGQRGERRVGRALGARQALVQRRHVQRTEDQRALDQVAQLAHVAGPVVLLQVGQLVDGDVDRLGTPSCGASVAMKCSTRSGMSSLCERSGGR
jgi:hypothetical protein